MHAGRQTLSILLVLVSCGGGAPAQPPPVVKPPPSLKTSTEPGPTALLPEVLALGIDPTKDTDLAAIEISKKKKVMKLFTKALGTDCTGCHTDDFRADTRNKKIARHMWKDFVSVLRDAQGNGIFCDSCHQGKMNMLARDDDKVLAEFMKTNYVGKMKRADGAEHKCATCHGDPFEPDIFKNKFKAE